MTTSTCHSNTVSCNKTWPVNANKKTIYKQKPPAMYILTNPGAVWFSCWAVVVGGIEHLCMAFWKFLLMRETLPLTGLWSASKSMDSSWQRPKSKWTKTSWLCPWWLWETLWPSPLIATLFSFLWERFGCLRTHGWEQLENAIGVLSLFSSPRQYYTT